MQPTGGGGGFLAAAPQGMFAVDPTSAEQMIRSIEQIQERLKEQLRRIHALKVKAKLGDLPEALAIAERNVQVAAGDEQSLEYVLQRFVEALEEARQGLEIAMRNYTGAEAHAEHDFRQIGNP